MLRLSAAAAAAAAAALLVASPALAHEGHAHPDAAAIGWTLDPTVTVPLAAALVLYLVGLARLRARARLGRRDLARRAWLFCAGWLVLAGALVSPLHAAGEVSFAMHMLEHELIMLPAALLLVAAHPGATLLWGLPVRLRRAIAVVVRAGPWRALGAPVAATVIQAAILIIWHMPALFDRALEHPGWHIAQHLSFIGGALLFWWAMLAPGEARGPLVAAMCLFATAFVGGGLGALMALDRTPWFAAYARMGMTPFGLTPAEDQQLAGLLMWIPGGLFHLGAALAFVGRALAQPQKFSITV